MVLAALMTPPWPIVIATTVQLPAAFHLLAEHLAQNAIPVTGVNAPQSLANRFVREWRRHTARTPTAQMDLRLYRLTEVQPVPNCPGSLTAVDDASRDLAVAWAYEFQQDTRVGDARESVQPHVDGIINTHNAFLWVDRQPVCMAFRERPHATGVSIGYVYTPPQHRRKGYATSLVADVSRQALHEGFRYLCAVRRYQESNDEPHLPRDRLPARLQSTVTTRSDTDKNIYFNKNDGARREKKEKKDSLRFEFTGTRVNLFTSIFLVCASGSSRGSRLVGFHRA